MFRRRPAVQNEIVARQMRRFFRSLDTDRSLSVAKSYGEFLWDRPSESLVNANELARSRFNVGLSTRAGGADFEQLTKRAALVSDTLLLCHDWTGEYHDIGESSRKGWDYTPPEHTMDESTHGVAEWLAERKREHDARSVDSARIYGMHCPDLAALGEWIVGARGLLEAGLVWYLPSYSVVTRLVGGDGRLHPQNWDTPERPKVVDFLIRDGRAVDTSDVAPVKSHFVRPVLQMELPYIDGVGIKEFSKITTGEFASYSAFRDFLRLSFLDMDESMNAVQADRELVKLGLRIKDQVRAVGAEMEKVRRRRAVAVTGAVVGSVGAILIAVYGPALAAAVAAVGAGGGLWNIVNAATDNSSRGIRENKWYYVWVLARKSGNHLP
jgi:hypothetical protein